MSQAKVAVRDLSKVYEGRNRRDIVVLNKISLDIRPEEFICIVGPSGCGKTTFIKIIDGLVKATAGEVYIDGRKVSEPGYDRAFALSTRAVRRDEAARESGPRPGCGPDHPDGGGWAP